MLYDNVEKKMSDQKPNEQLTPLLETLIAAKESARILANTSHQKRNLVLKTMAEQLKRHQEEILRANVIDLRFAKDQNLSHSMLKRLELNPHKIDAMADSINDIITLDDPIHQTLALWKTKAGLEIRKISVPIGVIGVIYESRPNVTSDVSALCFKSGNVCVLKGGKEAHHSNHAILTALKEALELHHLPLACVSMIEDTSREGILEFVKMDSYVDLLIPRGGEGLITFVKHNATIPVIKHDKGICHLYVHKEADLSQALTIAINAKTSYPAACNACETLLLDFELIEGFLPTLLETLRKHHTRLMFEDEATLQKWGKQDEEDEEVDDGLANYEREYGTNTLNIKIVSGFDEAINHITTFGSQHSEAIVTQNEEVAQRFLDEVDAACVYVNASTRFSDGGEFGFGAEIGISTSKIHARGPMGIESLRSYKYQIKGNGAVR